MGLWRRITRLWPFVCADLNISVTDWRHTLVAAGNTTSRDEMRTIHVGKAEVEARLVVAGSGEILLTALGIQQCIANASERQDAGAAL